jgi:hypothetical protein
MSSSTANKAEFQDGGMPVAQPVYLVDQSGNYTASGGGGGSSDVAIHDNTTISNHLAVDGTGKIGINNFPATQPVSGSVSVSNFPGTQATTVTQPDTTTTGTITAAQPVIGTPVTNATVTFVLGTGQSVWGAVLSGTFSAGSTIVVDHSRDGGTTWIASSFKVSGSLQSTPVQSVIGGATLELNGNDAGVSHLRVRCSVFQGGDSISVSIRAGYGIGSIGLLSSIPAGSNTIGGVQIIDSAGTNKATIDASGNQLVKVTNANTNGQATMSNSAPVVLASNQSPVPMSPPTSSTSALTSVAAVTSSTQLLAVNANRKAYRVYNDGTSILYLAESGSASTTAYTVLIPANGFFESPVTPVWQGAVFAIWSGTNGNARITELS